MEIIMSEITQPIFRAEQPARCRSLLVLLALAALPMSADTVLVTNFGPGDSYDTSSGDAWATGGSGESGNAVEFQNPFSSSYLLTSIQVADGFSSADPDGAAFNDLNVGIWQSTTDNLNDATELQSWSVAAPSAGSPSQVYSLTSASPTIINPSDYYFITETLTPDGSNTAEWGWNVNNLTPTETGYLSEFAGGRWFSETGDTPVFSVSGTVIPPSGVPEPRSYAAILGAGLLGLLVLRRRRTIAA
jgi:hypothetical protein